MKKKIINGLLFAVALVAATSSFVSCKDYNGDNYAELQEKYATLQDAFRAQVQAMQDYVLKTTFNETVGEINGKIDEINKETGYSAAELANKGTIKARLDAIENELDPNNPNSLAEQVHKNNQAILSLGDTLNHFVFMWGDDLASAYANAGKAKQIALSYDTDTAKINQAIKEAQDIADKAWKYVNQGMAVDRDNKTKADLQAWVKYFEAADDALADDIAALKQDVNNIFKLISQQVTGIEIQATYNPIFGTFSSPIDIQTNMLCTYYSTQNDPVVFPAGDVSSQASMWANGTPAVLSSELDRIGAGINSDKVDKFFNVPEKLMNDKPGNAGRLYLTVNPSDVTMVDKEFTLRASDNSVSKVSLSGLHPCDEQLLWGYKRAAGNGFYYADATISKNDVENVALSFNMSGVKDALENIMKDWSKASPSDVAKIFMAVADGMRADVPRLGVQAQWKDTLGWKSYVSKYELAAFSVKALGFADFENLDFSPAIVKFKNQLIAKEKSVAQDFINKVAQLLVFQLNLTPGTTTNVEITEDKVYVVIPNASITNGTEVIIAAGSLGGTQPTTDIKLPVLPNVAGATGYKIDITPIFAGINDAINTKLAQVNASASGSITKVLNKVIDIENSIFDKVISAASNPARFVQPALVAHCGKLGFFYPSRTHVAPTLVKRGQKIMFYPTTLTGEIVVPAFKKYVAITAAYASGNMSEDRYDSNWNSGALNNVFDGTVYNAGHPFEFDTKNVPDGTVLEFVYECLDYKGKIAGKKYYIEIFE